jgi:hypothetical protein
MGRKGEYERERESARKRERGRERELSGRNMLRSQRARVRE